VYCISLVHSFICLFVCFYIKRSQNLYFSNLCIILYTDKWRFLTDIVSVMIHKLLFLLWSKLLNHLLLVKFSIGFVGFCCAHLLHDEFKMMYSLDYYIILQTISFLKFSTMGQIVGIILFHSLYNQSKNL